jgi:hypothetical protein
MSTPNNVGGRNSPPQELHVSAISERIVEPQAGHAEMTVPPQSGHSTGTATAFPAMNRRPHPQLRQKPQQSPSSRDRSYPMAGLSHTAGQ